MQAVENQPEAEDGRQRRSTKTYFLHGADRGLVKIGKAYNVRHRLAGMQCASPVPLVCFAIIDGDYEDDLHERFHHLCVGGEWFRLTPELIEFVRLNARECDISIPPLPPDLVREKRLRRLDAAWRNWGIRPATKEWVTR